MIKNIPPKIDEYGYWNKDSMQYKNKNISKWLVYTKKNRYGCLWSSPVKIKLNNIICIGIIKKINYKLIPY